MLAATIDILFRYGDTEKQQRFLLHVVERCMNLYLFCGGNLTVDYDGEQTVIERLQLVVSASDYLMKNLTFDQNNDFLLLPTCEHVLYTVCVSESHHYQQIRVSPGKHTDVHGHAHSVRLIETHAEIPLAAQQQQDEHADVHQTDTC